MNDQNLKEWLQASDATASEPVIPPLEAKHLEGLVARRRIRRRGIAAVGLATTVMTVALLATSWDQSETASTPRIANNTTGPVEPSEAEVETLQAQLETLQREIDERKALVAALRQANDLDRLNRELVELVADAPPPLTGTPVRFQQARNHAAAVRLYYANALAREFGETELAATEYRAIASRYPGTVWSTEAERALPQSSQSL